MTVAATCPNFFSSFSSKWVQMIINVLFTKQSLLPQFFPLMCILSLWWYNQSKREEKWVNAKMEEFRGWLSSWEHRALIPKGILHSSETVSTFSCRPGSKQQHLHISHISSPPWLQPDTSVPKYTFGLFTVFISCGWLFIKQVNVGYSCTWCFHLYQ